MRKILLIIIHIIVLVLFISAIVVRINVSLNNPTPKPVDSTRSNDSTMSEPLKNEITYSIPSSDISLNNITKLFDEIYTRSNCKSEIYNADSGEIYIDNGEIIGLYITYTYQISDTTYYGVIGYESSAEEYTVYEEIETSYVSKWEKLDSLFSAIEKSGSLLDNVTKISFTGLSLTNPEKNSYIFENNTLYKSDKELIGKYNILSYFIDQNEAAVKIYIK